MLWQHQIKNMSPFVVTVQISRHSGIKSERNHYLIYFFSLSTYIETVKNHYHTYTCVTYMTCFACPIILVPLEYFYDYWWHFNNEYQSRYTCPNLGWVWTHAIYRRFAANYDFANRQNVAAITPQYVIQKYPVYGIVSVTDFAQYRRSGHVHKIMFVHFFCKSWYWY